MISWFQVSETNIKGLTFNAFGFYSTISWKNYSSNRLLLFEEENIWQIIN